MHLLRSHIVPDNISPIRLGDYAFQLFGAWFSRKGIKKAIKRGAIRLDGKTVANGIWIRSGQIVEWYDLEEKPPKDYDLDLEVLFEDDFLAVVHKPAGIVVSGNQYRTIENALSGNLEPSTVLDALRWPKPVHRLDAPTAGLLVVAKSAKARVKLGQAFEQKTIQKTYHAIVIGKTPEQGLIDQEIEDKKALTKFERVQSAPSLKNEFLSLLRLHPETGRTHQLRRHLSGIGYPILGDALYGKAGLILKHKGLFLVATGLEFNHPIIEEPLQIQIDIPEKFKSLLEREQRRWEKYNK